MSHNTGPTPVAGIKDSDVLDGSDLLPNPLLKIRDSAISSLARSLGKMFDGIDDSFFELADGAGSNSEQTMYFDSMREVRIKRRSVENIFKHEIHKKFRDLLDPEKAKAKEESVPSMTSDEMSIVQDDIMEESVAITSMVMKARNSHITDLYNIQRRVDSLFHHAVSEKNNPLDPQQLCDIFAKASEMFDLDIRAKILVYKQFDRFVMSQLPLILNAANRMLIEAGVLPKLKIKARRSRSLPPRRPAKRIQPSDDGEMIESGYGYAEYASPEELGPGYAPGAGIASGMMGPVGYASGASNTEANVASPNVASPMGPVPGMGPQQGGGVVWSGPQQSGVPVGPADVPTTSTLTTGSAARNYSGDGYISPHAGVKGGVFHLLQDMMSESPQYGKAPIASSDTGKGHSSVIPQQALLGMLSQLQGGQAANDAAAENQGAGFNIREALQQILATQTAIGERSVISRIDEDTINLVSMFFDFILDDHNLPTSIQALIGRLQIPVLKVAIKDKAFFNKGSHPARKLLNELARAGLGLDDSSKDSHDTVYEKIAQVVRRILTEYNGEVALFAELYSEFSGFIRGERKRAALVEQRTREIAQGKAKTESARKLVDKMIQDRIEGQNLPELVDTLLRNTWGNLLFRIGVKHGPESEKWYRAIDTVDQLVWSLSPGSNKNSRQRWVRILPIMLKSLREGLNEISCSPSESRQFFDELEKLHMEMLDKSMSEKAVSTVTLETPQQDVEDKVETGTVIASAVKAERAEDISELILKETAHIRGSAVEPSSKSRSQLTAVEMQQEKELAASYVYLKKIEAIELGTWMEFSPLNEPKKRCRLALKLSENDHLIFVNRRGMKVMDWSRSHVATEMRKGRVTIIDSRPLFDRALDTIVGALGTKKKTLEESPATV